MHQERQSAPTGHSRNSHLKGSLFGIKMTTRLPIVSLAAGAVIVAAGACLTFLGGMPSITSTLSLPFILLIWPLSLPLWAFPVVSVALFVACSFPYSPRSEESKRSLYLAGSVGLLSGAWFVFGYRYAIKYQTFGYFVAVAASGVALFSVACVLLHLARKKKNQDIRVLGSAVLFCWLVWLAFPYMGELP